MIVCRTARVTVPTSNSLNIFSSKETEYDNRASLLKRLGVVIYASDLDEYVKFFHSIQGKLQRNATNNSSETDSFSFCIPQNEFQNLSKLRRL